MLDETLEVNINLLREKFESRWRNLVKNSEKYGVPTPNKELVWIKILSRFQGGRRCAYCDCILMIKDSRPLHPQVFSIDHKISLDDGGDSSIENLEIVCHRCNIVKGTIRYDTFQDMINILPPTLLDRMFEEMIPGRMASKLNRVERFK